MTLEDFQNISGNIPHLPGVYKYLDEDEVILYVGKAKNLKKRLSSYFGNKKNQAYKTRTMVRHADHIDYIVVDTESDALLLENTLIKKYQPRYNVNLKDDKSYTYICVKKERFPRVFFTRKVIRDGSTYFGPYTSKFRAKMVFELIKSLFPVRTCTLNLSEENIRNGKFKVCLEYHIHNCFGPCEDLEEEEVYNARIKQIKNMLRGHFGAVKRHFKEEMNRLAGEMEFEKAQQLKVRLDAFEDYQSKSTVVGFATHDMDVFSIDSDEKFAYVNYLKVVNGAIINTYTQELTKNLNQEPSDLLTYAMDIIREKTNSVAMEIVVPFKVKTTNSEIKVVVPRRGDKLKLLQLSEKNLKYYLLQKRKEEISRKNKKTTTEKVLEIIKDDLRLDALPLHIECFDNSNIQGSYPVASCVVFRNGKPYKKDYRKYNIKTVEGPNDFASMEEVVYRRYKRLVDEEKSLPQLVIIDGGKGQLSSAVKSLKKLELMDQITVVGIAKKLEEIFFPNDSIPLYINKKSPSLKVIQQLRNEAHRFAITFHRDKRSKAMTTTELTTIPGIGEKTAEKLLRHFGSVKKIKSASVQEVSRAVGRVAAAKVVTYFAGT